MEERLKTAVEQLNAFVAGPLQPQTGEALLKLGLAYQRMAGLQRHGQGPVAEKINGLNAARNAYARLLSKEFGQKSSAHGPGQPGNCQVHGDEQRYQRRDPHAAPFAPTISCSTAKWRRWR